MFDDNAAKREVLSLKVDCINKDTCKWTGELRELEVGLGNNHLFHYNSSVFDILKLFFLMDFRNTLKTVITSTSSARKAVTHRT